MDRLIRFNELSRQAAEAPAVKPSTDAPAVPRIIEQLRHRLVSSDYHDSVEVRTAVLGELLYQCFQEITKRRYL